MRYLRVLLLLIALTGCGASYTPAPTPWFDQYFGLPARVSPAADVRVAQEGGHAVIVTATGADPVYLLLPASGAAANPPGVALPAGYRVSARVDRERIAVWDGYAQTWIEQAGLPRIEITVEMAEALGMLLHPNPSSLERPADSVPPQTQRASVVLLVGSAWVDLPIELRYTLNSEYEQSLEQYQAAAAQATRRGNALIGVLLIYCLIIVGCCIAVLVLAWRRGGSPFGQRTR